MAKRTPERRGFSVLKGILGVDTFRIVSEGRRRTELEMWLHTDLLVWFRNRILPVTHSIADRWSVLDGQCQLNGTPLSAADGMIAATVLNIT